MKHEKTSRLAGKEHKNKYLKIKDRNQEDRPREKLLQQGPHTLSSAELLGILIGSGIQNMNSVDLAQQILNHYDYNLHTLAKQSVEQLQQFKGIGKAKAALIASALQLGHRLHTDTKVVSKKIDSAELAYNLMKPHLSGKVAEEFWVIMLNQNNQLIKSVPISKGGIVRTTVDVSLIFKQAILYSAPKIILIHNHPSGSLQPSEADKELTKKAVDGGYAVDVKVLDHIIFTDHGYFSFADQGMLHFALRGK